eukprot:1159485-Pelagomonas_calceolata.AAC.2
MEKKAQKITQCAVPADQKPSRPTDGRKKKSVLYLSTVLLITCLTCYSEAQAQHSQALSLFPLTSSAMCMPS